MFDTTKQILVVDDEEVVRRTLSVSLGKNNTYQVESACNGLDALERLAQHKYDLIITDLSMPEMDGVQLLRRVRRDYPDLPVVIFTGYGTLDDAIEALRLGAINFLQKPFDLGQIRLTVERVFALEAKSEERRQALGVCTETTMRFEMPALMSFKQGMTTVLVESLVDRRICEAADLKNVSLALDEVLSNAIVYGCMGMSGKLSAQQNGYNEEQIKTWESQDPAQVPRIIIEVVFLPDQVKYIITDPGAGFDFTQLPHRSGTENLESESGRGLLLVKCFMDEVTFTPPGNKITLVKRKALNESVA